MKCFPGERTTDCEYPLSSRESARLYLHLAWGLDRYLCNRHAYGVFFFVFPKFLLTRRIKRRATRKGVSPPRSGYRHACRGLFPQVSVEVMDVLMKYGTAGVAGLVLRREFVEAVEVLKRLSGVDK